jgi:hypothetical protein
VNDEVCFEIDDFINDQDKTHWVVDLSNGKRVYGDDGRPGLERVAWKRLRNYLYNNNLYITEMFIRFRSHIESVGKSEQGYFFKRGILASAYDERQYHKFIVGTIKDGLIHAQTWLVPEIIPEGGIEIRGIEHEYESLIFNDKETDLWNTNKDAMKLKS